MIYAVLLVSVFRGASSTTPKEIVETTPTPVTTSQPSPKQVKRPEPPVTSSVVLNKPAVFVIEFPSKVDPKALTTTVVQSGKDPNSDTITTPLTAAFSPDGKTMTITTKNPLIPNTYYSVYVRLVSNNHIVVKKRFVTDSNKATAIGD